MKTIGSRILELREGCGLSQHALAALLKTSHVSVGRWERDEAKPKGENLYNLASALNTTVDYIQTGSSKADVVLDKGLLIQAIADVEQAASILKYDYSPKEKATFIVARYNLGSEPPFSDVLAIFDNQ